MSDSFAVFVVRRAFAALAITVAIAAITFTMLRLLAPWGFDEGQSVVEGLVRYLEGVFLHLDFGTSVQRPFQPVRDVLADALPADLALLLGAMVFGVGLGVLGGVACARRPRSPLSRLLEVVAAVSLCAPVYFVGLLVIYVFGPSVGGPVPVFLVTVNSYASLTDDPLQWLHALLVPWIVAGLPLAAMALRMVRATMPEALQEDYARTALAKGLTPRAIAYRHALPVALPPTLSLAGSYAPMLIANVVLVEAVFGIPGVYRVLPSAMENGNFPVLIAVTIAGAVFVVFCNMIADIALAAIDPRVRLTRR
jgi:peptide/nickel transport system permease protein